MLLPEFISVQLSPAQSFPKHSFRGGCLFSQLLSELFCNGVIGIVHYIGSCCRSDPHPPNLGGLLVVEKSDASEGHGNAVLVAGHDDMVVAY